MAIELKINQSHKDRRVCHNNAGKCVGDHTQEELLQLALIARKSNSRLLINFFVGLPSLDELLAEETNAQLSAVAATKLSDVSIPDAATITDDVQERQEQVQDEPVTTAAIEEAVPMATGETTNNTDILTDN